MAHELAAGVAGGVEPGGFREALSPQGMVGEGVEAVHVERPQPLVDPDGQGLVVQALGSLGVVRGGEDGGLVECLGQRVGSVQFPAEDDGPFDVLEGGVEFAEAAVHGREAGECPGDEPVVDERFPVPGGPLEPASSSLQVAAPEAELAQRDRHRRGVDRVVGVLRGAHDRLHEVQPCVDVAAEAHDPREVAGPDAEVVGQRACPPDRLGGQPTRRGGSPVSRARYTWPPRANARRSRSPWRRQRSTAVSSTGRASS